MNIKKTGTSIPIDQPFTNRWQNMLFSPLRLIVTLVVSIFTVEFLVMVLLYNMPRLSPVSEFFLDAFLLSAALCPVLIFLLFRPLKKLFMQFQINEDKLKAHKEQLEVDVETRTTELRKSEEKYHILFLNSPDAYLIIVDGVFTDCNRATEVMLGGDRTHIIGLKPDVLSPEFQPDGKKSSDSAEEKINHALNSGRNTFEWVHRRFDGSEFLVEVSIVNISLNDKPALFTTWRDITMRKQAENIIRHHNQELEQRVLERTRSLEDANHELFSINTELSQKRLEAEEAQKKLQQLSSAVENSPATIVITNQYGVIEYVNPKFTEISGYLPEEAIGQNPRILNSGSQPKELYQELWDTILSGHEWHGDFCNRKKNGDLHWERASISPIRNTHGDITHFVAIKEDITEQRRITGELLTAQEAAHAANISKSEFLANMSHEIRTPLSAIIGFSDLLLKTSLPSRQHGYVQKIQTAGELLLSIINDILDFSKIEARQLEVEQIPFHLDTVLSNVINLVQNKALDKGLHLRVKTSPESDSHLIGDPHRLSQVAVNLLNNAVKFTEHGDVTLEITRIQQENDRVQLRFSIHDTGIGITDEQINVLFQPFTQADGSTTRRFGGTGLGLSISKQLVELMGGKIWCESVPNQGSTFFFTVWFGIGPAHDMNQSRVDDERTNENKEFIFDFSNFRILLVEDNETNQQLAVELLKDTGVAIDLAFNGMDAVTMITDGSTLYDLVLMDIQMPVMDGYEATRLIRSDNRFASLPIIAMTAHAMQDERQKILDAGIDAHITKPFNAQSLLQIMRFFLRDQDSIVRLREKLEDSNDTIIPYIAGLDTAGALHRLDGNSKLYLWLLQTFVENASNTACAIDTALQVGNTKLALRHIHTTKGSSGSMGAVELESLTRDLGNLVTSGESTAKIRAAFDRFSCEVDRLVSLLKKHLPNTPQSTDTSHPGTVNVAIATPILNNLLTYIKGRNGKAERYLDDYHDELEGLPEKTLLQLKKHLINFDFASAHTALVTIAEQNGITLTYNEKRN